MAQRQSSSSLSDEVDMLAEIYLDDLVLNDSNSLENIATRLELDLRPSTAQDVASQHVCLVLSISVPSEYPRDIPIFEIRKARGLSEAHIEGMLTELRERAIEQKGSPMLYELIELVKDHLTDNNRPVGNCPLCLHSFKDGDSFHKTKCYHYFHTKCIAEYTAFADQSQSEAICPVCRLCIVLDPCLLCLPSDEEDEAVEVLYVPDASMRAWQRDMALLYRRQMEQGGIIGRETDKKQAVLEISTVPSRSIKEETSSLATEDRDLPTENDREMTQETTKGCGSGSGQNRDTTKSQAVKSKPSRKPKYYKQAVKRNDQRAGQGPNDKGPSVRPPPGFIQTQPMDLMPHETVKPVRPPPGFQPLTKERPAYRPDSNRCARSRRPHNGQREIHTRGRRKGSTEARHSDSLSDL